jgi:hypothetical protein
MRMQIIAAHKTIIAHAASCPKVSNCVKQIGMLGIRKQGNTKASTMPVEPLNGTYKSSGNDETSRGSVPAWISSWSV